MHVLITGGAGYIGSITAVELLKRGHSVSIIDNFHSGSGFQEIKGAHFFLGDVLDSVFCKDVFAKENVDVVMHFAAFLSVEESMKHPFLYFENNVEGSRQLLEAMVAAHVKKIIFSSTCNIYGDTNSVTISETRQPCPRNPYAESKKMVEEMLHWYHVAHDISSVSLRYFNVAGATLDGSMGESHVPEIHIIPTAITAAARNAQFTLFGTDYPTSDGTCIRDYIHVLDIAKAHICAMEAVGKKDTRNIYNVGTGVGYSNREIVKMVEKITGKTLAIKEGARRAGDPAMLVADASAIYTDLSFTPEYSDLETIVATSWKWQQQYMR